MARADSSPPEVGHSGPLARADVAQVVGVVGGPVALLTGLTAKYFLVEVWACKLAAGPLLVHLAALATLLVAVACGVVAHRQWRGAGREDPEDRGGREGRTRMLAALGVGMSALCALVIVAQWLPQFVLSPCRQ